MLNEDILESIIIKNKEDLKNKLQQGLDDIKLNKTYSLANNIDDLSSLGKLLSNNFVQTQQKNNLKAI